MKILLLSRNTGAILPFLVGASCAKAPLDGFRIAYIDDAQQSFAGAAFVEAERAALEALAGHIVPVTARGTETRRFDRMLADVDAVYVASGSTFALLDALRASGNAAALVERVRAGLPYIGASAGSIVAGPDVTPACLMDDPADGPALTDYAGLALIDQTVIPHADGLLPPYPPELIQKTLDTYRDSHALTPLNDDQALLMDNGRLSVIRSEP
ncbi:Type 1 glutamine amidotransferase-like domain-containing protein [Curtobacterium sp. SP.BCo]|uniref:Type 1 glutamine amidotransferase-like domain-containing protein n=1 Tax=Curtobacterium sp. SP.BCo TaxID=3435229 RepID=UPI003F73A5F8